MQEVWKDITGYEGLYQVSNLGNIKSVGIYHNDYKGNVSYLKRDRTVKSTLDRGYLKLQLNKSGKRKTKYIHQLVAETFIANPNNYKEINHKDSNPKNNCVENLEWCDRKYNINYMVKHQKEIKERHKKRIEALKTIRYLALNEEKVDSKKILEIISDEMVGRY